MSVIRSVDARRSETPSGVMTTLASPTVGGAERSVWRVEVAPGAPQGPLHALDAEQIWTFLGGGASVEVGDDVERVEAGDTLVVPAAVARRVTPDAEAGFSAIVTAAAGAKASVPGGGEGVVPPWIA